MKADTTRRFLALHTWMGLLAGMALFVAFYAGAITVFSHEIADWNRSGAAAVAPANPVARTQTLLDDLLKKHPEAASSVYLALPGEHGPQPSAYWIAPGADTARRFALDDGKALHEDAFGQRFIEYIYDLHFTAGLPKPFGTYFFGAVCLLYGLALVSGVVIYAPILVRNLFALRLGKNLKRLWQDSHNAVGVLSLPFHVVFAWSGAVLALGLMVFVPFQRAVYDGKLLQLTEQDFYGAPQLAAAHVPKPTLPLDTLLQRGQAALPAMTIEGIWLVNAGDANARATIYGELSQRRLSQMATVTLDAGTGAVVATVAPKTMTPGMVFMRGLQALHFGNFGHNTVKWLYFVLGLAGAFLFYSGNLLWIETRRKRRQAEQPLRTRVMAALTLGICLGCVAGVSAVFIAGALVPAAAAAPVYLSVFFASVLWAGLRQPTHAGHELLWLCALLTAAIPLAGWVGSGEHLFAAAWHGHWHRFFVDAVALLLACVYGRMARATLHRGRTGEPNSVWALR
ncbi:MAG: PepSY domain-containing protein [Rhodanobacter sp.]|nr:MAG: PepSY domain-containing protein [Rhodanobacter sp.]TAM13650.1 MAG: PepSY domain-containing protein [Rhodanobacter sp.]TAM35596.1 MAG: PepSY domain-containing protein [Rhodanobacter sp.]